MKRPNIFSFWRSVCPEAILVAWVLTLGLPCSVRAFFLPVPEPVIVIEDPLRDLQWAKEAAEWLRTLQYYTETITYWTRQIQHFDAQVMLTGNLGSLINESVALYQSARTLHEEIENFNLRMNWSVYAVSGIEMGAYAEDPEGPIWVDPLTYRKELEESFVVRDQTVGRDEERYELFRVRREMHERYMAALQANQEIQAHEAEVQQEILEKLGNDSNGADALNQARIQALQIHLQASRARAEASNAAVMLAEMQLRRTEEDIAMEEEWQSEALREERETLREMRVEAFWESERQRMNQLEARNTELTRFFKDLY